MGLICGLSRSSVSSYLHNVLSVIHHCYRAKDLIRFPSFSERKRQGWEFCNWLLTTIIDCTEQEQLDSAGMVSFSLFLLFLIISSLFFSFLILFFLFFSHSILSLFSFSNNEPSVYSKPSCQIHRYLQKEEAMAGNMAFEFIKFSRHDNRHKMGHQSIMQNSYRFTWLSRMSSVG